MPAITAAQIAALCGGELEGDPHRLITGANTIEAAMPDELAFVANRKAAEAALQSRAGCLLVSKDFSSPGAWSIIRVSDARSSFAKVLHTLYAFNPPPPSIHPTAVIANSASLSANCTICAYVNIGERTVIGANCCIENGCRIGSDVHLGDGTVLHPNVTVYDRVRVGARVILHSGCVLSADGFGFALVGDHYEKFPQVGTVLIEDDVEIGANCCVDRAALGVTRIGTGTKL